MLDWTAMLIAGLATAALCAGWVVWQQLAGRIDPQMRGRKPAGKCGVPKDIADTGARR